MTVPQVCVCYLLRPGNGAGEEVLLGRKKRGLGEGKLVGPGGKLEGEETPVQAIVREVAEEAGLNIGSQAVTEVGRVRYSFPDCPEWDQESTVFVAREWSGTPADSDELELDWYPVAGIDYSLLWDDAQYWLPAVLTGGTVDADFRFGPDLHTVATHTVR
ncbi:hypothetical protein GCM10022198_13480 [Klugiella xanthotipulae]|uniref:Oxidized purine nucleoside triphosphate hydrolase n=1 Tax=Klugiella xanthotipulae TaxID=244735 RepID=A0A543I4B1_9MICO|nr:8-oxo-dGTP diphosphatase [Klugiella xanthotipulae]TQM65434.1 8-oxo-dGTP diphosphatase [Klugiella xanthotipulae]